MTYKNEKKENINLILFLIIFLRRIRMTCDFFFSFLSNVRLGVACIQFGGMEIKIDYKLFANLIKYFLTKWLITI